jgi:hypothetical protein
MREEWDLRVLIASSPASRRFVIIATLAWILLVGLVASQHEMWRDEADGWLYARDGDFSRIVDWTRHAGTPALWYFVVAPLARSGLPAESQQVLHLMIAAAALAVFLRWAPLTRVTKLLAAFGYFLGYEYAVIVRSYALAILLIFILAAMHRAREAHPFVYALLLALLLNTNAQGFCVGAALAALFIARVRKPLPAAIILLGALAAWWQVRPPADPMRAGSVRVFNGEAFPWTIGNAFLPRIDTPAAFIFGMLVLLAITFALRRSRESLLILWLPTAAMGLLYSYVWIGGLRHTGFVLIVTLVAVWIAGEEDRRASAFAALLLNMALGLSMSLFGSAARADVLWSFSGAKEMARYLRANGLDRVEIAAHNLTQSEAVLAYLPPRRFWYAGLGAEGSYMTWDAAFERALDVPYPVAERRALEHFGPARWLLLFNVEMPDPPAHGFRLVYATRGRVFEKTDERFWLYAPLQ